MLKDRWLESLIKRYGKLVIVPEKYLKKGAIGDNDLENLFTHKHGNMQQQNKPISMVHGILAAMFVWLIVGVYLSYQFGMIITYLWFGLPMLIGSLLGGWWIYNKFKK